MATITFRARIAQDLRLELPTQTLKDQTNAREEPADPDAEVEDEAITDNVAKRSAAKVESVLGSVGSYDDSDDTIGDMTALDLGFRWAQVQLKVRAAGGHDDGTRADQAALIEELKEEAMRRAEEADTPFVPEEDED